MIDSIVSTFVNGAAFSGVASNHYVGTTSQTADGLLSAAITSYTDTLVLSTPGGSIGVCYSVYQYTGTHYRDFPQFIAQIKGMKVDGGAWSATPALCLKDFIENDIYGQGDTTDATSFATLETDNDTNVTTEPRRTIDISINRPLPCTQWIKILGAYCSCWPFREGNTWKVASDRPRSTDHTLTTTDWVRGSFATQIARAANIPTVVKVKYTDTTETIWREREAIAKLAGVSAGTVPTRTSVVNLTGVTKYSQATVSTWSRLPLAIASCA